MGAKEVAKAETEQFKLWHEVICHLMSLLWSEYVVVVVLGGVGGCPFS